MVKTKNPIAMQDADKEDAILISVTRDGRVFPEPRQHADPLGRAARQGAGSADQQAGQDVYIKADARAKYEAVEDVVDNLRAAGVDQIGLITETAGRRGRSARDPAQ